MTTNNRSATTASAEEPAYLDERQVAARLNMSVKWLQKMRLTGGGPLWSKFGDRVRYSISKLEEFERQAERSSTSDPGPDLGKCDPATSLRPRPRPQDGPDSEPRDI